MKGKEAIIAKIRADAQRKANSTLEEGSKKALEAISIAHNDAKIYKDKHMAESYIERDEIVNRKITVANLEVKKMLLQVKKDVIDKAFDEAMKAVKADKKAYLELIGRMLTFAEDGDVVTVSKEDKKIIEKSWVINQAKANGKNVTFNDNYGDFFGGLILSGKGSDKNLTLEVEMASVRNTYEPEIAQIIFGA